MQIDYCLILAAGFGTRMGSIGKKLPKVLWPVFEKSLLELQVSYAKSLGIEKIYINLHYMGEEIENFCKSKTIFDDVVFLWEKPEILDIGGAVHHLAARNEIGYRGHLLILNADQFFYLSKDKMHELIKPHKDDLGALFTYFVDPSLGYNQLLISEDRVVKKIVQNKDLVNNDPIETYTGMSFVNLSKLKKITGKSSFFESVLNFSESKIPAILLDKIDYWDFGTLKRFWETCFYIVRIYKTHSTHPFIRFLVEQKAIKTWKINLKTDSYYASSNNVINLNQNEEIKDLNPCIILSGNAATKITKNSVWWNEIVDEVN